MKTGCPTEARIPPLKQLWREAFGDGDEFIESFFETGFSPDRCMCVTFGEDLAAMAYWLDGEYRGRKIAYVYAVATAEAYRGRGLCRQLLEEIRKVLKTEGYAAAMLCPAGEDLEKMYEKMGYRTCCRGGEISAAAGNPVPIQRIGAEEYGMLRRRYLPEQGLIQEGASLAFLARWAEFYAGEDFLLAVSVGENVLEGIELLGRREAAPGITASLGCHHGIFHLGANAMALALEEDAPIPGYLGFAFN